MTGFLILKCALVLPFAAGLAAIAPAQDTPSLPYMNAQLSAEQRAEDLVHRMALEEKASQMANQAAAIDRLKVQAYNWWSEALHGVIDNRVTEFPEPIGLAATFDTPTIHTMATDIGIEGRVKHVQDVRAGHTGIMGGLDFRAPNLNIFRAAGKYTVTIGGGKPGASAPGLTGNFEIKGQINLPE